MLKCIIAFGRSFYWKTTLGMCCALISCNLSGVARAETLYIWIDGFIPSRHDTNPGYVRPVPNHPGDTMIPGPFPGKCYNTNNRLFSSQPGASAKFSKSVTLSVNGSSVQLISNLAALIDATREYDCSTGQITCSKTAAPLIDGLSQPQMSGGVVRFHVEGSAANPCIPTPPEFSVRFSGDIAIDTGAGTINYTGYIAQFPSYEAYVSVDNGPPITIFQKDPAPGSSAWNLAGNNRSINETVSYRRPRTWSGSSSGAGTNFGGHGQITYHVDMMQVAMQITRNQSGGFGGASLGALMTERAINANPPNLIRPNRHQFSPSGTIVGNNVSINFAGAQSNAPRTAASFVGQIANNGTLQGTVTIWRTDLGPPFNWRVSFPITLQ